MTRSGHFRRSARRRAPPSRSIRGALAFVLALAACGGDEADRPRAEEPSIDPVARAADREGARSERAEYVAIDVTSGGDIAGTARYAGAVPAPRRFDLEGEAAACGGAKRIHEIDTGAAGGLSNAVVSLPGIRRGRPPASAPAPTLDQRGCEFRPHILVAGVDDTVRVLNSDPLTHNVHTAAFDNRTVNRTQPAGGSAILLTFSAPERVRVQCDIHPWMSAWIIVTEHPYAAVTDETGRFVLPRVPPGEHELEVWHEALGALTRSVTVEPGGTAEVVIELTGRGP